MPEGYQESMWCIKKHMLLAKTHIDETIAKLARKCDAGSCVIDGATAIEAEDGVRNIVAAEEHVSHVLSLRPDWWPQLSQWLDNMRGTRQLLTMTSVPFRYSTEVAPDAPDQWLAAYRRVDEMIDEVDKYADEMKQEQVICPKCIEDVKTAIDMAKGFDLDAEVVSVLDELELSERLLPWRDEIDNWPLHEEMGLGDDI